MADVVDEARTSDEMTCLEGGESFYINVDDCAITTFVNFVLACSAMALGAAVFCTNTVSFCVRTVTADRKNTGVTMNWYGAGFGELYMHK